MTQDKALDILKTGKNVFLTGEPGAGKTHTINRFIKWCHEVGKRVAVTASTGIASTHINGTTIHSWSGIGIKEKITEADIGTMLTKRYLCDNIQMCDVLIVDEVSMLSGEFLDMLDHVTKKIRYNGFEPFGGLQVIFVGDFYQLPPVSRSRVAKPTFAFDSFAWKNANLSVCYLTEQHRQSDQEFLDILSSMRAGKVEDRHISRLIGCRDNTVKKTKLFTHNLEVDSLNIRELEKIDSEERVFKMVTDGNPYLVDLLKKSCLSPENLRLRIGAVVMFTKNNWEVGYVNGTLGVVEAYDEYNGMPIVLTKDGQRIKAKYEEWTIEDTRASISQIPLRLAWAITVHKSQGMSLDEATIDLSKCFEYGQGYVALSRVRSLEGLHLEGMNKQSLEMHPDVVAKDIEFRKMSESL